MADAFFTSAFGGIADMAGSAAGLVAVGNSPNRTSTCQLGGANEANQFYCESIHRSSWDQLGRLTLRLDFVCRVPDIKLSAATMTRNPLVLHADRGSVVAKKAALAFDPKVFLAVVGSGKTISHYRKGEAIFAQGDPGDAVFFIEKGRVKVTVVSQQGKEAIIAFLGPGDFIGEGCLGSRTRRISTASATTECVITRVEKSTMMKTLREEPKFAELFTSHLLARAIRVEDDLIDQLFNSSEKRLARTLLLMAHYGEKDTPDLLVPKVSQATLAEIIGTTRSRVSQFMNKFRKLGLIDYNGVLKVHPSLLDVVLHEQPQIENLNLKSEQY